MGTLKEIRKELKEKGLRKEDIEVAIELMVRLETLDELVFPENPATVNFSSRKHPFGYPIAHLPPDKDNKEIRYEIYVPGIKNFLKEEKKKRILFIVRKPRSKSRLLKPTWEELLVLIAAHEIRHRFQHDFRIKMFSPKSAHLVKEETLKWIIEFYEWEFKERKEIYLREKKSKKFIRYRINRKEFDATVIETLVANKIHRRNAYSLREEIADIIKLSAP